MIARHLRFVFDTNTVISAGLKLNSVPSLALRKALLQGIVIYSGATLLELEQVFFRSKFDRYQPQKFRQDYLQQLVAAMDRVEITQMVKACRDPKDDKFLELALSGVADRIITGDKDLLALDPFQGIAILTPQQYLES